MVTSTRWLLSTGRESRFHSTTGTGLPRARQSSSAGEKWLDNRYISRSFIYNIFQKISKNAESIELFLCSYWLNIKHIKIQPRISLFVCISSFMWNWIIAKLLKWTFEYDFSWNCINSCNDPGLHIDYFYFVQCNWNKSSSFRPSSSLYLQQQVCGEAQEGIIGQKLNSQKLSLTSSEESSRARKCCITFDSVLGQYLPSRSRFEKKSNKWIDLSTIANVFWFK